MIILASIFGFPVVLGIVKAIYHSQLATFKITGLFGLFLLAANNYIYYSKHLLEWLPLLQKISFLIIFPLYVLYFKKYACFFKLRPQH